MSGIYGPGVRAAAAFQKATDDVRRILGGKPDLVHICCCRADVALCGARVAGQDVKAVHPRHQGTPCLACLSKDQRREKCSDPKCPGPDPEGA